MFENRFKTVIGIVLVLKKGDQYLLGKRLNTDWMEGYFGLMGGGLDEGESIAQAAVREAHEELGIEVDLADMRLVHVMHAPTGVSVFVQIEKWVGQPQIMEPEKCAQLIWASRHHLPDNAVPFLKGLLGMIENGVGYSEYGW